MRSNDLMSGIGTWHPARGLHERPNRLQSSNRIATASAPLDFECPSSHQHVCSDTNVNLQK
jgi:hypothetical protein